MTTITIDEIWNANSDSSTATIGGMNSNPGRAAAVAEATAEFEAMREVYECRDPAEIAVYEPADATIVDDLDNPMTNAEVAAAATALIATMESE